MVRLCRHPDGVAQRVRRDPAKAQAWRQRSKAMAPRSARKIAQDRKRAPIVARLRQGPCEARIEGVCTGRAETAHEPLLRSRGGDPADEAQMIGICHACHRYAHDHPAEATERGLMRHAWDEP